MGILKNSSQLKRKTAMENKNKKGDCAMKIITTLTVEDFADQLMTSGYSHDGAYALANYLDKYEKDKGENNEFNMPVILERFKEFANPVLALAAIDASEFLMIAVDVYTHTKEGKGFFELLQERCHHVLEVDFGLIPVPESDAVIIEVP
jgi:hypothetical protein